MTARAWSLVGFSVHGKKRAVSKRGMRTPHLDKGNNWFLHCLGVKIGCAHQRSRVCIVPGVRLSALFPTSAPEKQSLRKDAALLSRRDNENQPMVMEAGVKLRIADDPHVPLAPARTRASFLA